MEFRGVTFDRSESGDIDWENLRCASAGETATLSEWLASDGGPWHLVPERGGLLPLPLRRWISANWKIPPSGSGSWSAGTEEKPDA